MQTGRTIAFIVVFFGFTAVYAQSQPHNYAAQWAEFDQLDREGKVKNAKIALQKIAKWAAEDHSDFQSFKSQFELVKLIHASEEEGLQNAIFFLDSILPMEKPPYSGIFNLMMGNYLMLYRSLNSRQIADRTSLNDTLVRNLEMWSYSAFNSACLKYYLLAFEQLETMSGMSADEFEFLLNKKQYFRYLKPTILDAASQLFLSGNDYLLVENLKKDTTILLEDLLKPCPDFLQMEISESLKDSNLMLYLFIKTFQTVMDFHANGKIRNTEVLIDYELMKLNMLKNSLSTDEYFNRLQSLDSLYADQKGHDAVLYQKALFYREMGAKYKYSEPQTQEFQPYVKLCYALSEELQKSKSDFIAQNAAALLSQMDAKRINYRGNYIYYSDNKLLLPITYQNIDSMYLTVYKIKPNKFGGGMSKDSTFMKFIQNEKIAKRIKTELIRFANPKDFQIHASDILIEDIGVGNYYFVFHTEKEVDISNLFTNIYGIATSTQVNILKGKKNFLLTLNADNGKPVPYAKLKMERDFYLFFGNTWRIANRKGVVSKKYPLFFDVDDIQVHNKKDVYNTDLSLYANGIHFYKIKRFFRRMVANKEMNIFTDRSIYRPGQTVYFKGIYTKNRAKVLAHKKIEAKVFDANQKEIYAFNFKTNKFGSLDTSFQIPIDCKTGYFNIKTYKKFRKNIDSKSLRVEEYKRPNFEIKFDEVKENYRLGDSVKITGNAVAYSGALLSDATVKYTITYGYGNNTLSFGEIACDDKGKFTIPFLSQKPTLSNYYGVSYNVKVEITDINGETQSQSTHFTLKPKSLYIDVEMPDVNLTAQHLFKGNYVEKVKVSNGNGKETAAVVTATIEQLLMPPLPANSLIKFNTSAPDFPLDNSIYESYFNKSYSYSDIYSSKTNWSVGKTVFNQTFNSLSDSLRIANYKEWEAGTYRLVLSTLDKNGETITDTSYFNVYNALSSQVSTYKGIDINFSELYAQSGKKLNIAYSSILKDAHVFVIVQANNKVKKTFWLKLNQEQKTQAFKVRKNYKGLVTVNACVTQNGYTYENKNDIWIYNPKRKPPKKAVKHADLEIETEHLANTINPGASETWRLKISNLFPRQQAEILALMYDYSLDQFAKNSIYFRSRYYGKRYSSNRPFYLKTATLKLDKSNFNRNNYLPLLIPKQYETLNLFYKDFSNHLPNRAGVVNLANEKDLLIVANACELRNLPARSVNDALSTMSGITVSDMSMRFMSESPNYYVDGVPSSPVKKGRVKTIACPVFEEVVVMESAYDNFEIDDDVMYDTTFVSPVVVYLPSEISPNIQIRKNFQETAFFLPSVKTDKDGSFVLEFTTPESLTKWKFLALAHTKNLRIGNVEKFFQTQKTLMLTVNRPRFLREGDTLALSVKIANLSDSLLNGKAKIEFFDGQTNQPIDILLNTSPNIQDFQCEKNTVVQWRIVVPKNHATIGYKVVAQAGNYSDGEEFVFPVLPNRILVTESMPVYVNGNSQKTFSLEKLQHNTSATLDNYSYTLEFTANPAWYAVQSLPYLMEYRYDCNEQIFSKLYANAVGLHIVQSNAKVREVFEAWENAGFESKLNQNEELKNILLEETPWTADAQKEEERWQNLAKLFNTKRMQNEISKQISKLQHNQNAKGAWGWFNGLSESRYITQHIVAGIGHLQALQVNLPDMEKMLVKAQNYLDKKRADEYDSLLKNGIVFVFSNLDAHYLYARSFSYDTSLLSKPHVIQYLKDAEKTVYQQDIYTQALLALSFYRFGKIDLAKNIMESIRQQAFTNEEMGMYWKNVAGYYAWHQAPIERQALLIEAFSTIDLQKEEIEQMKLWLIKQKQTQSWSNTKATADACYALLLQGTDLLSAENDIEIAVGTHRFQPAKTDSTALGTAYFKTTWTAEAITPDMGKVEIQQQGEGSAYGAVYWQYFEELDKITTAASGLQIEKKLYKVRTTPQGEELQAIDDQTPIVLGDKIVVRMIITTDRNLEYLHLKDLRASAFEPVNVFSTAKQQNGIWYYEATRDAATNFFIPNLDKGTHVFEYRLIASQTGSFSNGIATIQSMYVPEFSAHSEGIKVKIEPNH